MTNFYFCRIPQRNGRPSKAPSDKGWTEPRTDQNPFGYTDDHDVIRSWIASGCNIGLCHAPSLTCALDIDDLGETRRLFAEFGVPLDQWLADPGAVMLSSGVKNRAKLLFRIPEGVHLQTHKLSINKKSIFELRCCSSDGVTHQDVCAPSRHPDTGQPYTLSGKMELMQMIPSDLLGIWLNWDKWKTAFSPGDVEQRPVRAETKKPPLPGERLPWEEFNARFSIDDVLLRNGYKRKGKGRWLRPESTSGIPGLQVYEDGTCFSFGGDALGDGHKHDAFSVFRVLECGGDYKKAAAWDPELVEHNRRIWNASLAKRPRLASAVGDGLVDEVAAKRKQKAVLNRDDPPQPSQTRVQIVMAEAIEMKPVEWLWHNWLPKGKLVLLAGKPGVGKTTLAMRLAATVTTGAMWPDGTWAPPGDVLIWSGEDSDSDTLRPRFYACEGDSSRLAFIKGTLEDGVKRCFDPATDCESLRNTLVDTRFCPSIIIIDSISSAVSGDSNRNSDTRRALQPLVDIAEEIGSCIIGITHFTKHSKQSSALDRVTGSVAFGAVARMVLTAGRLQGKDDDETKPMVFTRAKSSLGPDGGGFEYDIRPVKFDTPKGEIHTTSAVLGKPIEGDSDHIMSLTDDRPSIEDREDLNDCEEWLVEYLRPGGKKKIEIMEAGQKRGFKSHHIRQARERLGLSVQRATFGGQTLWMLPAVD